MNFYKDCLGAELTLQTVGALHPEEGKKNQKIPADKYEIIKAGILKILKHSTPTYRTYR